MGPMKKTQDDIWVDSAYVGNPWEAKPCERPEPDKLRRKPLWREPRVWITAAVLLVAILACTIFTVVAPPMCKLNLRMMFKNYTVTVSYQKLDHIGAQGSTELRVNGNVIAKNTGDRNYVYYEIEDGVLYKYVPHQTGWEKEESSDNLLGNHLNITMPSLEARKELFDARNYEPSRWEPFVWNLKDDVDVGSMDGVRIERKDGHFTLTWGQDGYKFCAVFSGFLFTYFPIPSDLIFNILFG